MAETVDQAEVAIERPKQSLHSSSIVRAVLDYWNMDWRTIAGRKRLQSISTARIMCGYLLRRRTHMSYCEIGTMMGRRDHSTVMYYVQKCGLDMIRNPAIRVTVEAIELSAEALERDRLDRQKSERSPV